MRTIAVATSFGLVCGTFVAFAADPAEERRQLEATKFQRDEARKEALKRDKELQAEVSGLKIEGEALAVKMLETARAIQAGEVQMSSLEARMGELEAQEGLIRGSLEKSHGSISSLLAAMQRMGRNPPPVMVTRREDALTMVRSAMLLASAFPELRGQALVLSTQLNDLVRVIDDSRKTGETLKAEAMRLEDNKLQIASLVEKRKQTLVERQRELVQVRKDAAEFSRNVSDLNELIAKLDRSVSDKTRLGAYERQLAEEALARGQPPAGTGELDAGTKPAPISPPVPVVKSAALGKPVEELRPSITLQPSDRLLSAPGRIQPAIPFEQAKGRVLFPAQGRQIQGFGDRSQSGHSDGIVIETRAGAQVVAPNDGWIMYAGEFRSYGQILIINAGGGYHVLLAGLSQIDVQVGQFVLAGEPIGLMVASPKFASVKTQETAPVLYVEFRKNQRPIDPGPWWAQNARKVAG